MNEKAHTLRGAFVTAYKNRRDDLFDDIIHRYARERAMNVGHAERILLRACKGVERIDG